jgi:hypothetical protein
MFVSLRIHTLYLRVQQEFNEVYSPDSFEVIAEDGIHTDYVFRDKFLLCKLFLHNYQKLFCIQETYQNSCRIQVENQGISSIRIHQQYPFVLNNLTNQPIHGSFNLTFLPSISLCSGGHL